MEIFYEEQSLIKDAEEMIEELNFLILSKQLGLKKVQLLSASLLKGEMLAQEFINEI